MLWPRRPTIVCLVDQSGPKRVAQDTGKGQVQILDDNPQVGMELPHSIEEAFALDALNGNRFWRRAIEKEMRKIRDIGAFEV